MSTEAKRAFDRHCRRMGMTVDSPASKRLWRTFLAGVRHGETEPKPAASERCSHTWGHDNHCIECGAER